MNEFLEVKVKSILKIGSSLGWRLSGIRCVAERERENHYKRNIFIIKSILKRIFLVITRRSRIQ